MSTDSAIDLLQPHAYYYQFGNIRIASKSSDKFYRLDAAAIVLLSQIVYWHPKARKHDYWIYKTQEEFSQETALSCKQIARARDDLVALGLLKYELKGYPPKAYFKLNTCMFDKYAEALADKQDDKDPTVYISVEELEALSLQKEDEYPASKEQPSSEIPEGWFSVFAQIRECGFYKDKSDKDTQGNVYGYNQKLYKYISEILDGTFYDNSGKNITTRHNLTGLTKDRILEWITMENRIPAGGTDYAHRTIVYTTSKATYSPMLNALCGTANGSSKPSKFIIKEESYEPGKGANDKNGDRAPESIWFGENNGFNERPDKYYPELVFNHPRVWGLYHMIKDYATPCKTETGIWTIHNKPGTTISELDILYWILKVASEHGVTSDEIFQNIIIGDDHNYLWALVMQFIYNKNSYKLARDEIQSKYLYCRAKDIDPSKYTRAVGKGAKK